MRQVRVGSIQPLEQERIYTAEPLGADLIRTTREANLDLACRLLSQAGEAGCDIVAYPEDIQGIGHYLIHPDPGLFTGCVERLPGPTSERIAGVARKHRMHVVYSQYELVGETIYNAAVLLGRDGEIIGTYYKVQLPSIERWVVAHGDSFPVFQTDFGTVGMMVCYDINFPEITRCLVLRGAELVFCPTMGVKERWEHEEIGLIRPRMRAIDNFVPVVVSSCRAESVIVGSNGEVLAQARPRTEEVISAVIDLDGTPVDHSDWELSSGLSDVKGRFFQERLPEVYRPLTDPRPAVLERYRDRPLRPAPKDHREFVEDLRRWRSDAR